MTNFNFVVLSIFASLTLLIPATSFAQGTNKLLSVSPATVDGRLSIGFEMNQPVGYRYTVYDSQDPVRVVVDFPAMDVSGVGDTIPVGQAPVNEIRVSSFDLESGKLGRIEVLLDKPSKYEIELPDNRFILNFAATETAKAQASSAPSMAPAVAANDKVKDTVAPAPAPKPEKSADDAPVVTAGNQIAVKIDGENEILLQATDSIDDVKHFTLGTPPRLVVDVFGVEPASRQASFEIGSGFKKLRVGKYAAKTRYVFDAASNELPAYDVVVNQKSVVVKWGEQGQDSMAAESAPSAGVPVTVAAAAANTEKPQVAMVETVTKSAPVKPAEVDVIALDFAQDNGESVFSFVLSGDAEPIVPEQKKDNIVIFGVNGANIDDGLRRVFDASAFPSAILSITPYTVAGDRNQVRFAAQLRGDVPFRFEPAGTRYRFIVEDGSFGGVPVKGDSQVSVAVSPGETAAGGMEGKIESAGKVSDVLSGTEESVSAPLVVEEAEAATDLGVFTGEKITLIFDNADIRQILQLIGDVSGLNIIAGDGVGGTITLRLIDVPWDQALNLILDIKDLGMVKDGNIARILPREEIFKLEEAKLTAKRSKEKLEDLVTEVVPVSYTSLGDIAGPVRELLSERGKLTEDSRNKQLIITDIPSVLEEAKRLISILDTPEKQVMIEARIVEADSTFSNDLGVKWGLSYENDSGGPWNADTGSIGLGGSFLLSPPVGGGVASAAGLASGITFGRVGIDSTILDLRISALETSGRGKVVSTPRVTTLNGKSAKITQGTAIPYQTTSDGGPTTEFVDATLSLEVTPVINPDDSVILTITATNSSPGSTVATGLGSAPAINKKEAETNVLVRNGETTVIAGIFVEDEDYSENAVPLLGAIPVLGHLFKSSSKTKSRSELLIFLTPRIVN